MFGNPCCCSLCRTTTIITEAANIGTSAFGILMRKLAWA
ncbi:hypothetical protein SLEP1_g27113 [Rubroshorea leprosula]|uniref:Uncharacterized protein n=1 Tax=Rubroshorea leprosula TaxID=152421 RepID=A0AAV5JZ29_9ROSI|nr:hypothetical protein SLEP1_g27113 [Rubroshorea leprosula]